MKEVIFSKKHPKGLVREVEDKKHPHDKVIEPSQANGSEMVLTSPNGTQFMLTVSDNGKLKAEKVTQGTS